MPLTLPKILESFDSKDRSNLCTLLEIPLESSIEEISLRFKWLYHSKMRAETLVKQRNIASQLKAKFSNTQHSDVTIDDIFEIPYYDELISKACQHLKAYEESKPLADLELFLSQSVIIAALQEMSPSERKAFFECQIDTSELARIANINNSSLTGPISTVAMLGIAQTSGFAVFAASTTALGFLTHAVGITLPFAIYTGMTSTIAVLIGPAGWLAAGLWSAWMLTQPTWKKLIPALVYIISVRSRMQLKQLSKL